MNKELVKANAHKVLGAFWHGIGGEAVSTFAGTSVGIVTGAVAAAIIPGGSETKEILQILGTITAGILGYKFTHDTYMNGFDMLANWHRERASELMSDALDPDCIVIETEMVEEAE